MYSVKGKKIYIGVEEGFSWIKDLFLNFFLNGFFG